jgi:hypothetical protein
MKNKKQRTHRDQSATQADTVVTRSLQGPQGVPFRSPIANVITVSSPLRPARAA